MTAAGNDKHYSQHVTSDIIAHYQELLNFNYRFWFYSLLSLPAAVSHDSGRQRQTTNNTCYHHAPAVKPDAATASIELLMMGVRKPETCSDVHKRKVINLKRFASSWLIYLNCMMMHGSMNGKL
jgi:hypothetical protein